MHFHVDEEILGEVGRPLGGEYALPYESLRPTFDTADEGVEAAMASAFRRWGPAADVHVEVSFAVELDLRHERSRWGAIATWIQGDVGTDDDEAAVWTIKFCECTDGSLAQLFNGRG